MSLGVVAEDFKEVTVRLFVPLSLFYIFSVFQASYFQQEHGAWRSHVLHMMFLSTVSHVYSSGSLRLYLPWLSLLGLCKQSLMFTRDEIP